VKSIVSGLSLAAALTVAACIPAKASVISTADIFSQFNAVVSGSFKTTSDVEGRLVAGSLDKGATFYSKPNPSSAPSSFAAVNAIKITACSSCNIDNGGSVNYVTSHSGSFNFNAGGGHPKGGLVNDSPSFAMSDFTTPLNAFQNKLAGMVANSSVNASDSNNFKFVVTPVNGTAVFDITTSQLAGVNNMISFTNETAKTIIINVTGTSFTQNFNFNADTYVDEHVIWNFEDATSLNFKSWHGAILAGDATVTNSSPLEGFLYAKNFNGNGELHDFPFEGSVPSAPEPATWAMMGLGFAALGFLGWRKTHRARVAA